MDDLHHLLARLEALEDVLAEGALPDGADELLHHLEVDVCLEQRKTDLARGAGDRLLVEARAPSEVAHGVLETVGERVEHGREGYPGVSPGSGRFRGASRRGEARTGRSSCDAAQEGSATRGIPWP